MISENRTAEARRNDAISRMRPMLVQAHLRALWSPTSIWPACGLLLLTSLLAILIGYFIAEVFTSNPWGLSYLGETPSIRANDLTRLMDAARGFSPIEGVAKVLPGEPVPYPPAAFVYLGLLAELPKRWAFVVFYAPCLLYLWVASRIAMAASSQTTERALWFVAITLSYPVLYVLDRGNLDAYAVLGCFAFIYLLARGRPKLAAVVLAAAAALKIYPAILSILLLNDTRVLKRDTRAFALFAILAVAESLLSLWVLSQSPATAMTEFLRQLSNSNFCYSSVTLCLNLSGAVPFKVLLGLLVTYDWYPSFSGLAIRLYGVASGALAVFAIATVAFRRAPLWQDVLLLTCVTSLVPIMSYDYKLALYFLPLLLLLEHQPRDRLTVSTVFLVAIMLSSFKWLYGPLHLWIHAITQIMLLAIAVLPTQYYAALTLQRLFRSRPGLIGIGSSLAVVLALVVWSVSGAGIARRIWAHSRSWCPASFAFSKQDPAALWGTGWSSFDGPPGAYWRWTTAPIAKFYLPVGYGNVGLSGVTALPPGAKGGTVNFFAAGLLKATIEVAPGENKPFAFNVNTIPIATGQNTIPIEVHAPGLVQIGDRRLGAVISGLRMTGTCPN